jgi:transcriptional regulator with XRE-family HTH domain
MSTDFDRELDEIFAGVDPADDAEAHLALDVASQFKALRRRRGLSQTKLARRLGISPQAISRIENPPLEGHNLARINEIVAAMDAYLEVTIVPLEDAEAYRALYLPKPVLEDLADWAQAVGIDRAPAVLDGASKDEVEATPRVAGERGAA